MLAIDTDLVVRNLVGDDPGQAARARRLIDNNDIFVCTTVLLETEWGLRIQHQPAACLQLTRHDVSTRNSEWP